MSFSNMSASMAEKLKGRFSQDDFKSTNEFDYLIFIGRFQPYHIGHKKVIDEALKRSRRVVVLVGSSNSARCYRNPFTFEERKITIQDSYPEEVRNRILILPLNDLSYNDQAWIRAVQSSVNEVILKDLNQETPNCHLHGLNDAKIGLIGHSKDQSSYYLKLFPEWGSIDVPQRVIYNATDIRKEYFRSTPRIPKAILPGSTSNFLTQFLESDSFRQIYEEYKYIEKYKEIWKNAPYDPVFVTVDAVVVQSGYILTVRRKAMPGKGLMALPGGFIDSSEKIEDAMIRELREETKIKVPVPVLRGNIKKQKVFDDPNRSARGRTITHAYLIELPPMEDLPQVKGGSDATKAEWIPIANLESQNFFEDHYHIIMNMIGDL